MVLGLMDFLLGGKRKTKVARNGQLAASSSSSSQNNNSPQGAQVPDGVQNPTENSQEMQFEEQNSNANSVPQQAAQQSQQQTSQQPQQSGGAQVQRRSVSEALSKIHKELKETNSRVTDMVAGIKNVENSVNSLGHRVDELEASKKESSEKFSQLDSNMSKFLSLYELINNQYNPFVTQEEGVKKVAISADGNSIPDFNGTEGSPIAVNDAISALPQAIPELNSVKRISEDDLEASLLELDTLNIEEAAGNAVPLTRLKNNTNSLVVILSWLEYLTKRVGIEETRNTLRYYTEVLRWITPEVFFDLDKYLRGMRDKNHEEGETLGVRDHIVSLYFISKLNEKTLDTKLTKAVLQIIKA
jgi:archaellum component FlaC